MLNLFVWVKGEANGKFSYYFSSLIHFIVCSNFLIVDNSSIWIYTYNGRLHLNPRYPGSQAQIPHLHSKLISLGLDTMAVRDYADQTRNLFILNLIFAFIIFFISVIHIFDLLPGASRQEEPYQIQNKSSLTEISLCRAGNSDDQYLVFIDKNRDLYITSVRSGPDFVIYKIGKVVLFRTILERSLFFF